MIERQLHSKFVNITIDANYVVELIDISEISEFVESVFVSMLENEWSFEWEKPLGNFIIWIIHKMSYTNAPIHDLLIRIKNAYMSRIPVTENIIASSLKIKVLDLLVTYKFIASYDVQQDWIKKFISVKLNKITDMNENVPVIKFHSKPSRRIYVSSSQIKSVAWHGWIGIISTNKWLMASHVAKSQWLWGEMIAEIY